MNRIINKNNSQQLNHKYINLVNTPQTKVFSRS